MRNQYADIKNSIYEDGCRNSKLTVLRHVVQTLRVTYLIQKIKLYFNVTSDSEVHKDSIYARIKSSTILIENNLIKSTKVTFEKD